MPLAVKKHWDDGQVHFIYDTLNQKIFGNYFEFNTLSELRKYAFKVDSVRAPYIEEFNGNNCQNVEILGIPIVYKTIDMDKSPGSVCLEILISCFSWKEITVDISENGIDYNSVSLADHPRLKFIKVFELTRNLKNLNRFYFITRFKGRMKNEKNQTFADTIDVRRRIPISSGLK